MKDKIKKHYDKQRFSRITRKVSKDWTEISRGYIVDYTEDFVVLQETESFQLQGFTIFPVSDIKKIRYNSHDKYYDKIMVWEEEKAKIGLKTKVKLKNWKSIFKNFQKQKMSIIVESESPEHYSFTIGEVKEVTDKSVSILFFDASGYLDDEPTKIKYKHITKVSFDDRYIDVMSKYTREFKS